MKRKSSVPEFHDFGSTPYGQRCSPLSPRHGSETNEVKGQYAYAAERKPAKAKPNPTARFGKSGSTPAAPRPAKAFPRSSTAAALAELKVPGTGTFSFVSSYMGHYVPNHEIRYLRGVNAETADRTKSTTAVCVPFFNEDGGELQRTLCSLHNQLETLNDKGIESDFEVLVILDGWWKASGSMKEYLTSMFPRRHIFDRTQESSSASTSEPISSSSHGPEDFATTTKRRVSSPPNGITPASSVTASNGPTPAHYGPAGQWSPFRDNSPLPPHNSDTPPPNIVAAAPILQLGSEDDSRGSPPLSSSMDQLGLQLRTSTGEGFRTPIAFRQGLDIDQSAPETWKAAEPVRFDVRLPQADQPAWLRGGKDSPSLRPDSLHISSTTPTLDMGRGSPPPSPARNSPEWDYNMARTGSRVSLLQERPTTPSSPLRYQSRLPPITPRGRHHSKSVLSGYSLGFHEDSAWGDRIAPDGADDCGVETLFVQHFSQGKLAPVEIAPGKFMRVTLLVKRDNRRKHNSHEWFFRAFSDQMRPDFTLLTDCGTIFDYGCLYYLVKHLQEHERSIGVTGRMRMMSKEMQGVEDEVDKWSVHTWLRAVQAYDLETAYVIFMALFNLSGLLPVMPGPCQLFRYEGIRGAPLDFYFAMVNQNPEEAGMLVGNLLLAEDRILSQAVVLMTDDDTVTQWEPKATFFFDPELTTERVVTQRRRWNNGALCGLMFLLLQNPTIVWGSPHALHKRVLMMFALSFLLFTNIIGFIGPTMINTVMLFAFASVADEYTSMNWLMEGRFHIIIASTAFFVMWTLVSLRQKYNEWMFSMAMSIGVFQMVSILAALVAVVVRQYMVHGSSAPLLVWAPFTLLFAPLLLSCCISLRSMRVMFTNFVQYLVSVPFMAVYLPTYSSARLYDLSWGNRPSDTVTVQTGSKSHLSATQEQFSKIIRKPQQVYTRQQCERHMWYRSMAICAGIVALNILLTSIMCVYAYGTLADIARFLMFSVAGLAALQLLVSLVYFVYYQCGRATRASLATTFRETTRTVNRPGPAKKANRPKKKRNQSRLASHGSRSGLLSRVSSDSFTVVCPSPSPDSYSHSDVARRSTPTSAGHTRTAELVSQLTTDDSQGSETLSPRVKRMLAAYSHLHHASGTIPGSGSGGSTTDLTQMSDHDVTAPSVRRGPVVRKAAAAGAQGPTPMRPAAPNSADAAAVASKLGRAAAMRSEMLQITMADDDDRV